MKPIEINGKDEVIPIVFVGDVGHIVGGDRKEIRWWQVNDGEEVGKPMDAGDEVRSIATSWDGKWIISGTRSGQVAVWNAESRKKVSEFKGHNKAVYAVDISPDATKIASGSDDRTVRVWSCSSGKEFLGPWRHDSDVAAVKFSPNGQFIATAMLAHTSQKLQRPGFAIDTNIYN